MLSNPIVISRELKCFVIHRLLQSKGTSENIQFREIRLMEKEQLSQVTQQVRDGVTGYDCDFSLKDSWAPHCGWDGPGVIYNCTDIFMLK